jgi:L-2-hydroxyglutarate oxidase LhgO
MYYVPGSMMAKTCVRGSRLMYEYADAHGIPVSRCGKLIVASNAEEHAQVEKLYNQGTANGVPGLRVLSSSEVRAMEPNVSAYSALWSPVTGVIDYAAVARHLAEEILETGRADIKLSFQAERFDVTRDPATGGKLVTVSGVEPGQPGPTKRVRARHVITCAGFYSDRVAQLAGGSADPRVTTFRGTYYQMRPGLKDIVKTNVYPVPSGGGIPVGVHFTPTVNERRGHQMIIGPGAWWCQGVWVWGRGGMASFFNAARAHPSALSLCPNPTRPSRDCVQARASPSPGRATSSGTSA